MGQPPKNQAAKRKPVPPAVQANGTYRSTIQPVNSAEECAQMALAFETTYPANAFLPLIAIRETNVATT